MNGKVELLKNDAVLKALRFSKNLTRLFFLLVHLNFQA